MLVAFPVRPFEWATPGEGAEAHRQWLGWSGDAVFEAGAATAGCDPRADGKSGAAPTPRLLNRVRRPRAQVRRLRSDDD